MAANFFVVWLGPAEVSSFTGLHYARPPLVWLVLAASGPGNPASTGGCALKRQVRSRRQWIRRALRPMETGVPRMCRLAIVFALALAAYGGPARAAADPGVTVFPGMEIRQGSTTCTLGFVEVRLRIALATGQCNGAPTVTDSHGKVLGAVLAARRNGADDASAEAALAAVEYEVITLAADATVTDLLPTGRQLQSAPALRAEPVLPVCHFGISAGQACGRVSSVSNGRFAMSDMSADKRDSGGPVYTLTGDNRATIVGLFDATSKSAAEAESWQAVMQQLYVDLHSPGAPQLPPGIRMAGSHRQTS
jgi:hypothetical protein